MIMRIPEWGLAFIMAIIAHMAMAVGLGGKQEVLIERGPGDGAPLIVGSLVNSFSGDVETEEATEADAVTETGEMAETEDISEAEEVPETPETEPVRETATAPETPEIREIPPVQESRPLEENREIHDAGPVRTSRDLKTAMVTQKLAANIIRPDELSVPEAEELPEPSLNAVLPSPPQEVSEVVHQTAVMEETRKPEIRPIPVKKKFEKKKPAKKKIVKKKAAKKKIIKKKRMAKGARADSRRGGSGGHGRAGGGGKGLGGRAMMSSYQGRVVAHLRRYKFYPKEARRRGIRGLVRVKFTINSAGRVISSRLVSGSGSPVLDSGAHATIRRANPFPSFPKGLGRKRMTFIVPISFNTR